MSVPSAKSRVMALRAYLEMERSTVWSGMPSSSTSMGWVISDSTSSGVMPGDLIISFTWVGEISGKASMGRFSMALLPKPISNRDSRLISSRWLREN